MLTDIIKAIYDYSISQTVRTSLWIFPFLECIHLYSMIFLITAVATFDLRLLGIKLVRESISISKLAKLVWKLASLCFIVNLVTGVLLFMSRSTLYYQNSAFLIKLLLIGFGVVYHWVLLRKAASWDNSHAKAFGSGVAAFASLALSVGVIAASRWIAFVGDVL